MVMKKRAMVWTAAAWVMLAGASAWLSGCGGSDSQQASAAATYYSCGMHPWVIQPRPGLCPICHMELTPLDPSKLTGELTIDPVVVQNIGVRVAEAVSGPVTRAIRTVGSVTYDENRLFEVTARAGGYIETLSAACCLGSVVEKGSTIVEFHSPAVIAAAGELRAAERGGNTSGGAARSKLRILGVSEEQIEVMARAEKTPWTFTVSSPAKGFLLDLERKTGQWIGEGDVIAQVADLSQVWVMVTLYEHQLPFVRVGQKVVMTLTYEPGVEVEGEIAAIYPSVDVMMRQVMARVVATNPDPANPRLKPGMFVTVELRSTLAEDRVLIPGSAVLDTGVRQVVYVSEGEGKFDPREVRLGVASEGGMVQVLEGVKVGEKVVTSGQFLLDSEANVRSALAKMIRGGLATEEETRGLRPGLEEGELAGLSEAGREAWGEVLGGYLAIGEALAGDRTEGIDADGRKVARAVDRLLGEPVEGREHFWHEHEEAATVRGKALELVGTQDIEEARLRYADMSIAMGRLIRVIGAPSAVEELHCPMYREGQGGTVWVQAAGAVRNPYFGASMLGCFDRREGLPAMASDVKGGAQ
ncbi:MAG: efflux RND transporter periplasmic adaptor subunit [Phycisphaeraceae bacterium]|nr:efflux RND transporter periplasmic adaptor subunit [Phycisphaeraceae bacterium]